MKSITLTLFFLINVFSINSNAQIKDDISDFFKMGGKIISAPLHFDSGDILNLSLVAAATTGSFFLDNTGRQWALHNRNSFNDNFFDFDNLSNMVIGAGVVGVYGFGLIHRNTKVRRIGLQLAEATFYATGVTYIFKTLAGRNRPFLNTGHKDFNPIQTKENNTSFPSGHTTIAFAFSTVMAHQIDNIFWKVGWYSAATLVGALRVYHDKHWVSDIVLGSAIGYFIGRYVINNQPDKNDGAALTKRNKTSYSLGMKYYNNHPIYSINFGYSF